MSMSFHGDRAPRIRKESIEYSYFIHIQGVRLYIINIIVHVICDIFMIQNGLKSSLDKPRLTLRQSSAKS